MIFETLFKNFEHTTNEKGYRVLPPQLRVIQGDSVCYNKIKEIYEFMDENKISVENIVFGMGGELLQKLNRDTYKFAIKASYTIVDGVERDVVKSPCEIDSCGNEKQSFKKSKSGKLKLVKKDGDYITLTSKDEGFNDAKDELITIFRNGELLHDERFETILDRI
jgi:nicotinamide phosphoribosyltransferase